MPNTRGARLAKKLIGCENQLAKLTKYNVKIVEQSGMPLIRLFPRVLSPKNCYWPECPVCCQNLSKGSSKCRLSNVVYEAKCVECLEMLKNGVIDKDQVGIYVGETSRTLVERVIEHVEGAEDLGVDNFITKHWATKHDQLVKRPRVSFKVLKHCKDALTRQVSEAILIESLANLNSRAEWGRNKITRLRIDDDAWSDETESSSDAGIQAFVQGFQKKKKKVKGVVGDGSADMNEKKTDHRRGVKVESCVRRREKEEGETLLVKARE